MGLNVLVVDDSDVIRQMIIRTLDIASIPVSTMFEAGNGREALAVLDESWIDLVLADINMPVMNGVEMLEHMQADPETSDVPVIVVSTEGAAERIEALMNQGVVAWIRKPFTPEEIRDVVNELTNAMPAARPDAVMVDQVLSKIMEQFAFVFPEAVSSDEFPPCNGELVVASLSFGGATTGGLVLAAPMDLCVEMAANVLGTDTTDQMARLRGADTLAEVLNMTGGHLATELEPNASSHLNPPSVSRMQCEDWVRLAEDAGSRLYLVDDYPVILKATLRASRQS